jgi:hypothetical protein
MALYLGNTKINRLYVGDSLIGPTYVGDSQVTDGQFTWTPAQMSNILHWWAPYKSIQYDTSTGAVSSWTDTINNVVLTPRSSTAPILNRIPAMNNAPGLTFAGGNSGLRSVNSITSFGYNAIYPWAVINRAHQTGTTEIVLAVFGGGGGQRIQLYTSKPSYENSLSIQIGSSDINQNGFYSLSNPFQGVVAVQQKQKVHNMEIDVYVNGTLEGDFETGFGDTGVPNGYMLLGNSILGTGEIGTVGFVGDIMEAGIWDLEAISSADLSNFKSYLAYRYGLTNYQ